MLNPHAILAQVSRNEVRAEWLVRRAKDEARKKVPLVPQKRERESFYVSIR